MDKFVKSVTLKKGSLNPYFCGYYGENGCSFGPFSLNFLIDKMNNSDKNCSITGIQYICCVDMDGNNIFIERQ